MAQPARKRGDIELSMFIPCFNESKIIEFTARETISALEKLGLAFELIIADDGSTDSTSDKVRKIFRGDDRIRVFRNTPNLGRGEILNLAFKTGRGKVFAFCDADLSADPKDLPTLIEAVRDKGYDVSTGSRWMIGSDVHRSTKRTSLSFVYNKCISLMFSSKVRDHQCGFKGFKRDVILELAKDSGINRMRRWSWDTEILVRAQKKGYSIYEFPILWREKRKTRVKPIRDAMVVSRHLLRLYYEHCVIPLFRKLFRMLYSFRSNQLYQVKAEV